MHRGEADYELLASFLKDEFEMEDWSYERLNSESQQVKICAPHRPCLSEQGVK
jgi:hypothetical protein